MRNKQDELNIQRKELLIEVKKLFHNDHKAAALWLSRPVKGLGYKTPQELIKSEAGIKQVQTFIARLEHGVFM